MAELSNVKLILEGKKNNQQTNRTILKKTNVKPSKKPVETIMPKIPLEVENLVSELKPKIVKTSQAKKVVKKSKNSEPVEKKMVPRTLAVTKQILKSGPKAQKSKEVTVSTIPVNKEIGTNKVEVKKKIVVKKAEIKSVKAKTIPPQPKNTSKLTIKLGSMKEKEELKPPKTDDAIQTNAKNKLQLKVKRVLKKKSNSSGGGKIVIPRTPGVKNELPVDNPSARP